MSKLLIIATVKELIDLVHWAKIAATIKSLLDKFGMSVKTGKILLRTQVINVYALKWYELWAIIISETGRLDSEGLDKLTVHDVILLPQMFAIFSAKCGCLERDLLKIIPRSFFNIKQFYLFFSLFLFKI